jgi:hypothetical protein
MAPILSVHLQAKGAAVANLHAGLLFLVRNQSGISDNDRRTLEQGLQAELRDQVYGSWTAHLVTLWQGQLAERFQLVVNGDVDEATANALNKLLAELGAPDNPADPVKPAPPSLIVTSTVIFPEYLLRTSGIPAGLIAVFYDQAPGAELELGRFDKIDAEKFSTTIALKDSRSVNLIVRLLAPGGKVPIAESEPQYGVRNEASVVLAYPDPWANLPEYDRLVASLAPYLRGRSLASLSDKERVALAGMAGVEEALVTQLLAATQRAAELPGLVSPQAAPARGARAAQAAPATSPARAATAQGAPALPPIGAPDMVALLYGLIKTFGDVSLAQFVLQSRAKFKQTLERMAADNFIQAPPAAVIALFVEGLAAARDALHFNLNDDELSPEAKVIFWVPAAPGIRSQLLDGVLDLRPPQAAIDAASFLTPAQKTLFAQAFRLFDAVGRYGPMLAALAKPRAGQPSIFTADGAGLAQDQLHRMGVVDWLALINEIKAGGAVGYPAAYRDKQPPETTYAKDIAANIAALDYVRSFATRLEASKIPDAAALSNILKAHPFDIRTQSAGSYFAGAANARMANLPTEAQLKGIESLQRAFILADQQFAVAETLLVNNYDSSLAILNDGKAKFRSRFVGALDADSTDTIYARAQRNFTIAWEGSYQLLSLSGLSLLLHSGEPPPPTLETLFGSADFCACEQCQSVYGAAAYLADLLHWMQKEIVCANLNSAYATLDARRPDIKHILLNCHNTNTVLPYIDLGNEILSYGLLDASNSLSLGGGLQTDGETEDLLLKPEHRFPDAEKNLVLANVTWYLPYDPIFDEARAYLDALGCDHATLVSTLSAESWEARSLLEKTACAAAYFGLVPEEFTVITSINPGRNFWQGFWGIADPGKSVGPLLNTREFTDVAALEALLKTGYVRNGEGDVFPFGRIAFPPDAPCDLDKAFLVDDKDGPLNLSAAAANRLMRFERLRRRAQLSVAQLDLALKVLGAFEQNSYKLDTTFVIRLAAAMRLAQRLKVSIDELLSWWGPSSGGPAAFSRTFSLTPADFTAAITLVFPVSIFSDGSQAALGFMMNLERLREIALPPAQILAMLRGTDSWTLTGDGHAADATFAADAKAAWEVVEKAIGPIVALDAEGVGVVEGMTPPPDLDNPWVVATLGPVGVAAARRWGQFREAFDLALAAAVGLAPAVATKLINGYVSVYSNDPGAETTQAMTGYAFRARFRRPRIGKDSSGQQKPDRDWSVGGATLTPDVDIEGVFTEMYRYLLRTARFAKALSVNEASLNKLVALSADPNLFPVPLLIFQNSFGTSAGLDAPTLLTISRAVAQAEALDVAQDVYFDMVGSFHVQHPNVATFLWQKVGAASVLAGIDQSERDAAVFVAGLFSFGTNLVSCVYWLLVLARLKSLLGVPIAQILSLVWTPGTGSPPIQAARFTQSQADSLRAALRARQSDKATWARIIQPIQDRLRAHLRDALVAYYLGQPTTIFPARCPDVDALYASFLIDPEMEPCMKTSRIVLAMSSAQLLVQRGLLGLEPDVCLDDGDKLEWEWRKNYRVWEAARKVFLYPENWIDPSLRLEKSEFFTQAQDQLLQDELNDGNVERAFNEYLSKLNEVARLDIRGIYVDGELKAASIVSPPIDPAIPPTIHVFARTWNPPYVYYYRRREADDRWSPWASLGIDIDGDHLIPVIFNRRLYLFWPMFIEKEHRTIKVTVDGQEQGAPYYEIKLCYSKYENGKWTSKKVLDGTVLAGKYAGPYVFNNLRQKLVLVGGGDCFEVLSEKQAFFFHADDDPTTGNLRIHIWREPVPPSPLTGPPGYDHYLYTRMAYEDGFLISACDERVTIEPPKPTEASGDQRFLARPYFTVLKGMLLAEGLDHPDASAPRGLYVKTLISDAPEKNEIFDNVYSPYTLTYPHQYRHALTNQPFFCADTRYTHFIEAAWVKLPIRDWGEPVLVSFGVLFVQLHQHPYCCDMLRALHRFGIDGVLAPRDQDGVTNLLRRQQLKDETYFAFYNPSGVMPPYPVKEFDFDRSGAYSIYNWEIFFHLPALIGRQLRLDQKHAAAIRWLSFIFDPTNREATLGTQRFWMLKPFFERVSPTSIQTLMRLLAGTALSPAEEQQRKDFAAAIDNYHRHPFEPHAVAEMRIEAYMRWTVMEYIETLIDWGDKLFRQDTMESVNEAMQLYIIADAILGRPPRKVEGAKPAAKSYADLAANLDQFSNAMVAMENSTIGITSVNSRANPNHAVVSVMDRNYYNGYPGTPQPTPMSLYFCIPENPQLMAYWDRVADRLFKIRHCRNIEGQQRDLALFSPEIDPALLVKATAAGLDLSDVLDNLFAPNPRHRFSYLLERAADFCNEVKALGGQLLSAFEKRDAEDVAELRQVHEQNILRASRNIKKMQVEEAKQSLAAAESGRTLAEIRLADYSGREYKSGREDTAIALTRTAETFMYVEQGLNLAAGLTAMIPEAYPGFPCSQIDAGGGDKISKALSASAQAVGILSTVFRNKATLASTYASYDRRQEDWNLQIKQATEEIKQAEKQIAAAEIRLAIAEKDLENHDLQVEQSSAMLDWMRSKFTNEKLYSWMSGELKTLHRKAYQLAFDLARQAQKAFEIELGRTEQYVEYGDWDSARQGLLAGERLSVQLKELEAAYMRCNTREFELTRSISLRLLDPAALMALRLNKVAQFELPEWLLQMEFPDMQLYAMRVKSVAVSLPCVTGPYTPANVKLHLLQHQIGWSPGLLTNVSWLPADMTNEIVTSSAVNDPALFEANLRDERYLPFENAGAVSRWEVSLPIVPQFDYQTISDLILHVRFVAKGDHVSNPPPIGPTPDSDGFIGSILLSWRHDFPDKWRQIGSDIEAPNVPANGAAHLVPIPAADLNALPYWMRLQRSAASPQPAPQSAPQDAWVLVRTKGTRELHALVQADIQNLSVTVNVKSNGALRFDGTAFFYDDTAAGAGLIVEDVIVRYKV